MSDHKQDWYFTFGFGHQYPNCYTVIHGTMGEAREEMVRRHGDKWAFQYRTAYDAGVNRFNLRRVE